MNWDMIAALALVVAALALAFCLPWMALQMNEAARQRRLAEYRSVMRGAEDSSRLIAMDHANADIWWRASKGIENLTDVERVRYFAMLFIMLRAWERAFHYSRDETEDDLGADVVVRPIVDFAMSNGVQEYWSLRKRWFTPDFQQWIEQQMKGRTGVDIYGEQFRIFGSADPKDQSSA
jgi:hypothetical protein